MLTGVYQSIPLIVLLIVYYMLDIWLMRRFNPNRGLLEKRDTLNTTTIFIALTLIVLQPVFMPWLGIHITASWGLIVQVIGVLLIMLGFLLMVWVRLHLKGLFSEQVELQPGHHLVNTGPYAYIRHPLYTTFYLMALGLLLIKPAVFELFILCFILWHFSKLAKKEDTLLSKELPGYKEYMAITPAFLPTPWRAAK